ncbi:hypothetical protein J3R30DRAFT_165632 [Lentinula aciculospora]|uniref:Uncharacterized protein n=1 Tax=Lentinula aciculospora TaxID=153920 RepID=A0A9W9AUN6_9AGAR|nr:hypothetical protein J3R30DRAFT_165632 [Lentinula aciculospora]
MCNTTHSHVDRIAFNVLIISGCSPNSFCVQTSAFIQAQSLIMVRESMINIGTTKGLSGFLELTYGVFYSAFVSISSVPLLVTTVVIYLDLFSVFRATERTERMLTSEFGGPM